MKALKILLVVSAFVLVSIPSFSQKVYEAIVYDTADYRVTYNMKAQLDSTNPEWIIDREAYLFIGDECSKFISRLTYIDDTLILHFKNTHEYCVYANSLRDPIAYFRCKIFKNLP